MNENYESVEFSAVKRQIAQRCAFDAGRALLMAQMPRFDTLWIRRELRRCAQASALLRVHLQFPDEDILDISAHLQRADKGMTLRPGEQVSTCGISKSRGLTIISGSRSERMRRWRSCANCAMR